MSEKKVIVRAFGARLLGGEGAEQIATEIFLKQNRLWNNLVEIERQARANYREALLQSDQELAGLQQTADAKQAEIDDLIAKRNRNRQISRSKRDPEVSNTAIKQASAELKEIRQQMKLLRERAKAAAKPLIEKAELERREKVKIAVQQSGLWWCHHETIVGMGSGKFDVARIRAMKEGTELRFRRFDGNGSFGMRFTQWSIPNTERLANLDLDTPALKIRLPLPAEIGKDTKLVKGDGGVRRVVEVRVGGRRDDGSYPTLSFLVTIQAGREFPMDAPLKFITLRREMHVNAPGWNTKQAARGDWKVVFTFSREKNELDNTANLPSAAVGIDFGFRLVKDENGQTAIRVATIHDGNKARHITLDHNFMKRQQRADELRSRLDGMANHFREAMIPLLKSERVEALPEDDWFRALAGKVVRAKGAYASQLMRLCVAHKNAGDPLGEEVAEKMKTFHRESLKLALVTHHTRRKAIDNRKHIYRNVAAELARTAGQIGVEDIDLRQIAALEAEPGQENDLAITARRNRTWAAPSELRLAIVQAAQREGLEVVNVPAMDTTRTCSSCGHVHGGSFVDLIYVCDSCGAIHDQDENAAVNIRKIALGMENTGAETTT